MDREALQHDAQRRPFVAEPAGQRRDVVLAADACYFCRTLKERRLPPRVHEREAMHRSLDRLAALEAGAPALPEAFAIHSDILGAVAASAALSISDVPFQGPTANVRVGRVNGKFKAFPTYAELKDSDLELTVAATPDSIVMLEAGANQMPEAELIEAIEYGEKICQQLNELQRQIIAEMAQPKMAWSKPEEDHSLEDRIRAIARAAVDRMAALGGRCDFVNEVALHYQLQNRPASQSSLHQPARN